MREIRRVALACLVCVMMGWAASAFSAVTVTSAVRGSGENAGVTWLWLRLQNRTTKPAKCKLELTGYTQSSGRSEMVVDIPAIPPGQSRDLNLAIPALQFYGGMVRDEDGSTEHISISSSYGWERYVGFLHVADQARFLSEAEQDAFNYRVKPDRSSTHYGGMGPALATSATTPTLSVGERLMTQATPDTLPENWACYVPLYNVIMDEKVERSLSPMQQQALDTWLSLGGTLTVYGADSETTEARQAGRIFRVAENPLLDPTFVPKPDGSPFDMRDKLASLSMPYTELRAGGRNGAFALATLFLIIAGPVNYFYFSRRGQIRKLIVSLPVISLGFCSLIGIYFIFTQGFQRKGGSISLTTLDEGTNRAVNYARHSLLSGLYPLNGFAFARESFFLPLNAKEGPAARMDLSKQIVLEDGLFQPGIPFDYATVTPQTTRERMIYDSEKSTLQNGFELPVKGVVVMDGERFYRGGGGAPGARIALELVDVADLAGGASMDTKEILTRQLMGSSFSDEEFRAVNDLVTNAPTLNAETSGTRYAVMLDGVPKGLNSGIEISDGKNLHVLVGTVGGGEVGQ